MTIIEIRPLPNGWKCFEAEGVEPVFLDQEQAIDYAKNRASLCLHENHSFPYDPVGLTIGSLEGWRGMSLLRFFWEPTI
jgi:hypothetical protein